MRRPIFTAALLALGCSNALELTAPEDAAPPDAGRVTVDAEVVVRDAQPADAALEPSCQDDDGDGYGPACDAGDDCDDGDPARHPAATERCNGVDDDCDGATDEVWTLDTPCALGVGVCAGFGVVSCSADGTGTECQGELGGEPSDETCNGLDDDCDGEADEGVARCCQPGDVRPCGEATGLCTEGQQICDGALTWTACSGQGPVEEQCNNLDDDCDGLTDEGLQNACGDCGPLPEEACNGVDDDCDGQVDEDTCRAYLLNEGDAAWTTPPGLNRGGPWAAGTPVRGAASVIEGGDRLWVFTDRAFWIYDIAGDRWLGEVALDTLPGLLPNAAVSGAYVVPMWWSERWGNTPEGLSLVVVQGTHYSSIIIHPVTREVFSHTTGTHDQAWGDDPRSPARGTALVAFVLDLRNAAGWWPGNPQTICDAAPEPTLGPTIAVHSQAGTSYTFDTGTCGAFVASFQTLLWSGFLRANPPPIGRLSAWTHLERPMGGQGLDAVFVD